MSRLCLLLHRWSKWKTVAQRSVLLYDPDDALTWNAAPYAREVRYVQERTCARCGRAKLKTVRTKA